MIIISQLNVVVKKQKGGLICSFVECVQELYAVNIDYFMKSVCAWYLHT